MRRLTFKNRSGALEYTICRRARVTKRLHMELDELGGLVVVAPRHWSKKHIDTTLVQNISRVERFLAGARQRQLTPLQYAHGESHLYLGKQYPLAITQITAGKSQVAFFDDKIRIDTPVLQREKIQTILQNWYRRQAMSVFTARLEVVALRAPWASGRKIPLKLRKMKRTWGNCSSRGLIKLNTHLVKAPLATIDSVIAHELCHLEEMNHGRAFYALLESINPDWRQDRVRLRAQGYVYLRI
jgi:predicted metal-dependent hydrolase